MRVLDGYFNLSGSHSINGKRRPMGFSPALLVDEVPQVPENGVYRSHKMGRGTLYLHQGDGWARFFHHDPKDETGYGGAVYSGILEDGTPFSAKGPWSSSCSVVNNLGLADEPLAPVAVRSDTDEFPTLYHSATVGVSVLRQFEKMCGEDWELVIPGGRPASDAPYMTACSDEQRAIVMSPEADTNVPFFRPRRELENCENCGGRSSIPGKECRSCHGAKINNRGYDCWDCGGKGWNWSSCPVCQNNAFLFGGFKPYPWIQWWDGKVVR